MTLPFPAAEPLEPPGPSNAASVPPTITLALNVRPSLLRSSSRNELRMRAASKIAPSPTAAEKIPAEWAWMPETSSRQLLEPRRATVAVSPAAFSNPSARSLRSGRRDQVAAGNLDRMASPIPRHR
jgi:hypothetical protein